ncbi:hypothetical protein TWF281_001098 [Arthrobotrys megalospora]
MSYVFYRYDAEAPAALLASGFFALILAFSAYHMYSAKSWFLCANIIAISMEIIGLMARFASILRPQDLGAFITSVIFLAIAPSIQVISLYILAGRIISRSTPSDEQNFKTLWFKPEYLVVTFVAQDFLAFSVQLFGVAFLINATNEAKSGVVVDPTPGLRRAMHVLVFGFSLQILTLLSFLVLVARFQVKSMDWLNQLKGRGLSDKMVKTMFYILYLSAVLLLVRTVYRLNESIAETTLSDSFLVTREWPFWVFEIFVVSVVYSSYLLPQYPGKWFARGGPLEHNFETATKTDEETGSNRDSSKPYAEFDFGTQ